MLITLKLKTNIKFPSIGSKVIAKYKYFNNITQNYSGNCPGKFFYIINFQLLKKFSK